VIVTVQYHREEGTWWAESDQLPGFTAVADSFIELARLVRESIKNYPDDLGDVVFREEFEGSILVPGEGSAEVDQRGLSVRSSSSLTKAVTIEPVESQPFPGRAAALAR
jgi:predicted RNase H-like HicB family nuclease